MPTTYEMSNTYDEFTEEDLAKIRASIARRERRHGYAIIKRTFDIVASACALIVLLPLLLIIALVVFIDDPHGSPIFSQPRVGKNGKTFQFYKFRSMVVNAEELLKELEDQNEMDGHAFKMKNDPRITKVGRFIRQTSIDELPQLWNILKGDMSVVGPRPPLVNEVAEYTAYERLRLSVTPGLTCAWQVQPHRNELSFSEWVVLDVQYIYDRTLWGDLKLIFQTIGVVFTRQGR